MPAPYHPNKRSIGQLLSVTSPSIIVPDWQRNYAWTTSHVETFWNDLVYFEARMPPVPAGEYFLGSVVLVETSAHQHLLLDGQQRLATSAILLAVIRKFIKTFDVNASRSVQQRYLADMDYSTGQTDYKLTLNAYDRDFFRREILEYPEANYEPPTPVHASHRLIRNAKNFLTEEFQNKYEGLEPKAAFDWSMRIQNILMNHVTVIAVSSTDEDNAAEVFETLNDRGIGLSTPDLVRTLVLRRAPGNIREDIVELWGDVIEFETDTAIKTFLRHYWISQHGDVKTQRLYREIKTHIIDNDVNSLAFSRELKDASEVYRNIMAARHDDREIETLLHDIVELGAGAKILYPVLLSIFKYVDTPEQTRIIRALVHLFVRHSVIAELENSRLENVIYRVATMLGANGDVADAIAYMAIAAPIDETVVAAFQRLTITHSSTRRYLLRRLEDVTRTTEELQVSSPARVHVEHIYPQNPREGERLDNHNQLINRIGNLTLLSSRLNMAIRNGNFGEKKLAYAQSEILITKALEEYDEWNAETIATRQTALADLTPTAWEIILPEPD